MSSIPTRSELSDFPNANSADRGVECIKRKCHEETDFPVQCPEDLAESLAPGRFGSRHGCGVGQTPVGGCRLIEPEGTGFRSGLVTEGDHVIDAGRTELSKLVQTLGAEPFGG